MNNKESIQSRLDTFMEQKGELFTALEACRDAAVIRQGGDIGKAEAMLRWALEILERELPSSSPSLAQAYSELGLCLKEWGVRVALPQELEEAVALYTKALAIDENESGPESELVSIRLNNRGTALSALFRDDEAIADLTRAYKISETLFGNDSKTTALRAHNLAGAYESAGKLELAEQWYRKALEVEIRACDGEDHPKVLFRQSHLSIVLSKQGRCDEALKLLLPSTENYTEISKEQSITDKLVHMNAITAQCYCTRGGPEMFTTVTPGTLPQSVGRIFDGLQIIFFAAVILFWSECIWGKLEWWWALIGTIVAGNIPKPLFQLFIHPYRLAGFTISVLGATAFGFGAWLIWVTLMGGPILWFISSTPYWAKLIAGLVGMAGGWRLALFFLSPSVNWYLTKQRRIWPR